MLEEITYPCKIDHSMQPAFFIRAKGEEPRPLLVALHTWSMYYTNFDKGYEKYCERQNWNLIYPHFRGPNWTQDACGSDFVVSDIEDAVAYMMATTNVDPNRVYLNGGSGGGHCTLLMAGRRPDLWTAVSAWCPISDIAAWHAECLNTRHKGYSEHIEIACGGDPNASASAAREALLRSPLTWLPNAKGLAVDINTGIHDGHTGSVPVSQAIRAYNVLANPEDRVSEEDIAFIVKNEAIPAHFGEAVQDPSYLGRKIHLRLQSANVRLTIFEGGHDRLSPSGENWLARQVRGKAIDWAPGCAVDASGDSAALTM